MAKYYYQMNKNEEKHLPNQWICCGMVDDNTKDFYINYFTKNDSRGYPKEENIGNFKVIITNGFLGNVAGREEPRVENGKLIYFKKDITENDIIERYNF